MAEGAALEGLARPEQLVARRGLFLVGPGRQTHARDAVERVRGGAEKVVALLGGRADLAQLELQDFVLARRVVEPLLRGHGGAPRVVLVRVPRDARIHRVDAAARLVVAVCLDVGEGEVGGGLVEGLGGLGCADGNAAAGLDVNLEGLVVGRRLRQAVAGVRKLVDVTHEHVVELLADLGLVGLGGGFMGHEAEAVAFGGVGARLHALFLAAALVRRDLRLQLLQVRKHRHRQARLRTAPAAPHRQRRPQHPNALPVAPRLDLRNREIGCCLRLVRRLLDCVMV